MTETIPTFPYSADQFRNKIQKAVEFYWSVRLGQAKHQRRKGRRDVGTRGEVTGGKQLDEFGRLLESLAKAAGYNADEIFFGKKELAVPGFYRPQKKWDFSIVRGERLIAAAEFKSQSGSFGNNCNNRTEEVVGLARDFWVAYREKVFGLTRQPWLGYLFLLEESEESSHPVALFPSQIEPLSKFKDTSYQDRYRILCETLVLERDFSATSLLLSRRPVNAAAVSFTEPLSDLSVESFCKSFYAHLIASAHA